jgi:DNA gyrase/topoisomerase IV subunit A
MTDSEEIAKAERIRLQLLDAISVGVENPARILEIASDADTPDDAAREIERVFGLSAEHARAVLELQFARMTRSSVARIEEDREQIRRFLA